MIRIYLDWNVISGLKTEKYTTLLEFIKTHKERLLFVYTPAHFSDLMKSYSPDNIYFSQDLEQLEWLCGNHLLDWINDDWEIPGTTPKMYFEDQLKKHNVTHVDLLQKLLLDSESSDHSIWNFGRLLKGIFMKHPPGIPINDENRSAIQMIFPNITEGASQWELMEAVIPFVKNLENNRDFYRDFRRSLGDQGLKLTNDAGNWNPEKVFENIDLFFKSFSTDLTFKKYVDMTVGFSKSEKASIHDYFTTAYLLLDLIGYKPDKLPKPTDSLRNIRTDVEHAFFASRCDFFFTDDKNLIAKAKVLYKEFDIFTQVSTPDEFIRVLSGKIHQLNEDGTFIHDALRMLNESVLIGKYLKESDPDLETDMLEYKLPVFYFDFFTKVNIMAYPEKRILLMEFYRPYATHYIFAFHTEIQRLVRNVLEFFGYQNEADTEVKMKEFAFNKSNHIFKWEFEFGVVQLLRDTETGEPKLIYIIKV